MHARTIVACALDDHTGELVRDRFRYDLAEVVAWVSSLPGPQQVVYEAGPTGFGLFRLPTASSIECVVAAPSKLQRPVGDRVKTDARDALHLARLLLRYGHVYSGGAAWTGKHDLWLRQHRDGDLAFRTAFDSSYEAAIQTVARRGRLDAAIGQMATDSPFTPLVNRLGCLRGVGTLTGFALAVEITDWHRFTGNTIGAFLGLVPSEYSSGQSRIQGGITKTGNSHARRLMVEAAWHHRRDYRPNQTSVMHARWEKVSEDARLRGQAGNQRLHHQWVRFIARKKRPVVANVAIARELAGWCWSLAVMDH